MSSFSDMVAYLRKCENMSQKELADKLGVSRSTISMYESGVREPDFETLEALADIFNVNMDTLLGKSGNIVDLGHGEAASVLAQGRFGTGKSGFISALFNEEAVQIAHRFQDLDDHGKGAVRAILDFEEAAVVAERRQNRKKPKSVKPRSDGFEDVDVFDQVSAAGLGNYLDDPISHKEQYPANEVPEGTEFGVRISGISMTPTIPDGATVFVRGQPVIEPGQIGLFLLNGESYCKKLVVDREKREVRLASFNPDFKDRVIEDADTFSTMGRVLGWWPHE